MTPIDSSDQAQALPAGSLAETAHDASRLAAAGAPLPAAALPLPAVRHVPAVLVSAPASGHGKTTVVAALARRYTRQGLRVRVFKYGPDFLDPVWHAIASNHVVHNLDLWMTGEDDIRQRLFDAAADADLILIEGVMGLHDGEPSAAELAVRLNLPVLTVIDASAMTGTFGALAHGLRTWLPGLRWAGALANRVASPRHAALLAKASRRPGGTASTTTPAVRDSGVQPVAGKTPPASLLPETSPVQDSTPSSRQEDEADNIFLGCIRRDAAFSLPSRHLGLISGHDLDDAMQRLDAAADALADCRLADFDAKLAQRWQTAFAAPVTCSSLPVPPVIGQADTAQKPTAKLSTPGVLANAPDTTHADHDGTTPRQACLPFAATPLAGQRIAIARDAAFAFIYAANLDTLQALGASLCFFSPLAGDALPECDALWLPGGYPELHAEKLSACTALAEQIRAHVEAGKPVWAECGGMMVLFETLLDGEKNWPMWSILPGRIEMQKKLAGLGMQQAAWPPAVDIGASAPQDTAAGAGNQTPSEQGGTAGMPTTAPLLRGHTFHYSRCETTLPPVAHSHRPDQPEGGERSEAIYQWKNLRASYFHAWFASSPARAAALFLPAEDAPATAGGVQ
ncbi:MAG: cobyrinic acid a,c-diamide synthase [Lautropia sp.]|nr:cobyrinic acid a,c-diamide synthase [Lautropia sp.]